MRKMMMCLAVEILLSIFAGVNGAWAQVIRSKAGQIPAEFIRIPNDMWLVKKGSETFTLDEFVSSGKFCALYSHKWEQVGPDKDNNMRCEFCLRMRQRFFNCDGCARWHWEQ